MKPFCLRPRWFFVGCAVCLFGAFCAGLVNNKPLLILNAFTAGAALVIAILGPLLDSANKVAGDALELYRQAIEDLKATKK